MHHAHGTRASGAGGLGRGAWRGTGASCAHAVDGAGDADAAWGLCGGACEGGDGHKVAFARIEAALDAVAGRQKGVEALDEARVTTKEGRDSLDDAWGIYGLALELKREIQRG